jgi:hypothetical protein
LLPEAEVARRLNVSEDTITRWGTVGCRPLGKRLRCVLIDGERHYRPRDIRKIEAVPALRGGRLSIRGRWYCTEAVAAAPDGFNVPQPTLVRWRDEPCPWLRRKVNAVRVLVREEGISRFRKVWLYAEEDLEVIRSAKGQAEAGQHPASAGKPWPSTAEVIEDGFNYSVLKRARARGRIRSRPGVRVGPHGVPTHVTEWCPADLSKLRERREASRKPGYVTDREAGQPPYGLAATALGRWRDKRGKGCPYLGRLLDSYQDRETGVWYNSVADLREILSKRSKRSPGPLDEHVDAEGAWLPTGLVEKRYGIIEQALNNIRKRDANAGRRRNGVPRSGRPRSAPSIRSKAINRPHPRIPNGRVRVWHLADIERYLAWRQGKPVIGSAGPATAATAPSRGGPPRGGRPRSEATEAVLRFCYERYNAGDKLSSIRVKARQRFGNRAPKQDGHVTGYAKRYAARTGKPLNRPG